MSTLEKAIGLLQEMPQNKLEAVYMYIRFVNAQIDNNDRLALIEKETNIFEGVASENATEKNLVEKRQQGFQGIMSFAGTLPEDFDYKQELENAREEKYARFI